MSGDDYLKLVPTNVIEFVPRPGSWLAEVIELADECALRNPKAVSRPDLRLLPANR
jgi:hypothetical protein